MKQIGNWVFGSFFRTIGRLLVFVLLGIVIAHFVDFGSLIDNFRITDLFFEKVNASTNITSIWQGDMWKQDGTKLNYNVFGFLNACTSGSSSSGASACLTYFNSNVSTTGGGINVPSGYDYMSFRVMMRVPVSSGSYTNGLSSSYIFMTQNNWGSGSTCEIISDSSSQTANNLSINKTWAIKCPIINGTTSISNLVFFYNGNESLIYSLEVSGDILFYKSNSTNDQQIINAIDSQTNAIESQTQQQEQQHEEMMDTNMTETNETATSFFDSFESNDIGGLSGIVTAPLNMINKMLDGTCTSPSATWKGATISLPCGDMFWNRPGADDIKNLLNIFYGGFLCYYAIRKLFLMVENLKDPTQDRIEVSDL